MVRVKKDFDTSKQTWYYSEKPQLTIAHRGFVEEVGIGRGGDDLLPSQCLIEDVAVEVRFEDLIKSLKAGICFTFNDGLIDVIDGMFLKFFVNFLF